MRATIVLAAALSLRTTASAQDVARLDSEHQPLVRDFREGHGRARLIAILSPT